MSSRVSMFRSVSDSARTRVTLAVVCVAGGLLPASLTGSSIALPDIGHDLHAGLVSLQWVVNAYNVAFASVMLASGALADLLGRKRMFTAGLLLFLGCSLASGVAGDVVLVDVLRAAAGAGAAAVLTAGSALLAEAFSGAARARAFGILGSAFGVGLALGPSLSGVLVGAFGWRSVFLTHALIAAVVLPFAIHYVRESRDPDASGVDWSGTLTFTSGLFALTLGIAEGPQRGWDDPLVLGLLAAFLVLMGAFVVAERRQVRPMFHLPLFAEPRFLAICLMPILLAFGFVCLLVFLPSYFIGVNGMSAGHAGVTMLLLTVPVLVFPIVAGRLATRVPVQFLLGASLVLVAAGASWLTTLSPASGMLDLLGPLAIIGVGVGIAFGLLDGAAVSSVEPARAGMAAGMFNTMRLTSEAVAIAGMGSVLVSLTQTRLLDGIGRFSGAATQDVGGLANRVAQGDLGVAANGVPPEQHASFVDFVSLAYTDAFHVVLWILAAVCAAGVPIVVWLLRERAPQRAPDLAEAGLPAAEHA
jgi:predicted MFS family arabinose efflux permease